MTLAWLFGLALVAQAAAPPPAPCAGPGTICAEYDAATLVFLARVASVSPELDERQVGPIRPQTVTFDVIEDFKGTAGSGATLPFDPAASDARMFVEGETVLVYAKPTQDKSVWFAGCSRTRRVAMDDAELITLRQLQIRLAGASLEGTLHVPASPRPPAVPKTFDLTNLPVSLQALDGTGTVIVASHGSGYFLFPWLKPGTYRLRFEPAGYVPVIRDIVVGDRSRCQVLEPIFVRPR